MAGRKSKTVDLREACIQEAIAIIETAGLEQLSLREISRRLGVSHQAPYKHFPSRDHILAEIAKRTFDAFAQHLDSRPHADDPHLDLEAMGHAYLDYAMSHPLQYRLMFGTPLPNPEDHPEMMRSAQHGFMLLKDCIMQIHRARNEAISVEEAELDALYVWSVIHGMATLMQSNAIHSVGLQDDVLSRAVQRIMDRIGTGLRM